MVVAALTSLLLAGCGDDAPKKRLGPTIAYQRNSGGIVGGAVQLVLRLDGRAVAEGNRARPAQDCARGKATRRLPAAQLARLKAALTAADLPHTASRVEPAVESPDLVIRSGNVTVRFAGFRPLPERIRPLVTELEAAVAYTCRVRQ